MSFNGPAGILDTEPLIRTIKDGGLLNKTLMSICVSEGLPKTGVKSELQNRIILKIREYAINQEYNRFERLKNLITRPAGHSASSPYSGMGASSSPARSTPAAPPAAPITYPSAGSSFGNGYNMGGGTNGYRAFGQAGIKFKPSPFYNIEQQLGPTQTCDIMQHHRHTVKINLRASDHVVLQTLKHDSSHRVYVFCAADKDGQQEIAFPHQSEIKVNTGEIKANLRGLKNKPGSTRPVDITKELRYTPITYSNAIEMTYALTTKKFYLACYLVKLVPVEQLVARLKVGQKITEQSVLNDMAIKSRDPDIVATASVLSLKCPLSTLRISLPCRSVACRHNQCFDGESYLQLQEQGPTWQCPICNRSAPFETLAVDQYVENILLNTPKSVDQVTVQPDGKWQLNTNNISQSNGVASDDDDDDDLVEVTKNGDSVTMGTPQPYANIAPYNQRSVSTSSGMQGSISGKRPIATVIDLTSSGDEGDEPASRTPKRQLTNGYSATSSLPVYRPHPSNEYPQHY